MQNWEKILLSPEASILDALRKITEGTSQIVLVVDKAKKLMGTVTDGDIRSGLLKGIELKSSINQVMNNNPITCLEDEENLEHLMDIMIAKRIQQLPIVNKRNKVIGLRTITELMQPQVRDNMVVMMLGGLGKRLQPLTNHVPKPMLMVGDKPLLERNIEALKKQGFRRFCFSVGYKADMINGYFGDGSLWGISIQYIHEKTPLGTIGALSLIEKEESHPLLVINGDLMTTLNYKNILDFHEKSKAACTVSVREFDYQVPYGVVEIDHLKVLSIVEKPVFKHFVNAGIYIVNPETLKLIPSNTHYHMTEFLDHLLEKEYEISAFPITEYWSDIGRHEDYKKACKDVFEVFQ